MYTFYNVKGNIIESADEFVREYANIYYYLNDFQLENKIDSMLSNTATLSSDDFVTFVRWKVGDKCNDNFIKTQYGVTIDVNSIKDLSDCLKNKSFLSPAEDLYRIIIGKCIKNLGAVYSLSLVYLVTRGAEPIYDKFAEIALDVILDKSHNFRKPMNYVKLPDKNSIERVMKRYQNYKDKLNRVFGDAWKGNRDIDRALWTYGHLFR